MSSVNTGIEWIGEIPENWNVGRIGQLYVERRTKVSDLEYEPLSVTMKGILPQLSSAAKSETHDNRKLVLTGDFVINSRSDRRGACGISKYNGSVSLINTVLTPQEEMNPSYYDWLFHTTSFADEYYKWGHGIVDDLWTTNWKDMKRIYIPIPPKTEQKVIADFLNVECSEIDDLIIKTAKSIETYKKIKQALVSDAIKKGVGNLGEVRDSGVQWLGEIPKGWAVKKVKFVADFLQIKWNDKETSRDYIGLENIVSWTGEKVETDSEYDKEQSLLYDKGDILFGKLRPYLAKVYLAKEHGCCSGEFAVLRAGEEIHPEYLWAVMISRDFVYEVDNSTYGIKMPRANIDFLKNMFIPIPDKDEQVVIAEYVREKSKKIDDLIQKKNQLLIYLERYKKQLVYDCVMGKRKVVE